MALSSIAVTITNLPHEGVVEIQSQAGSTLPNETNFILISRRKHGFGNNYYRIYEKRIINISQLDFTVYDMTTKAGEVYDYYIELTDSNETDYDVIEFGSVDNIECWFDGIFVGNESKRYLAPLNCSINVTRNTQSNYVFTLAGRTPYMVSNTAANYTTGQCSAIFAKLDTNKQPITNVTKDYLEEVVDFLVDGTEKILKTSDGEVWYVCIDPGVSISSDDHYTGASMIEFNWTEIDDVPVSTKGVSA